MNHIPAVGGDERFIDGRRRLRQVFASPEAEEYDRSDQDDHTKAQADGTAYKLVLRMIDLEKKGETERVTNLPLAVLFSEQ